MVVALVMAMHCKTYLEKREAVERRRKGNGVDPIKWTAANDSYIFPFTVPNVRCKLPFLFF